MAILLRGKPDAVRRSAAFLVSCGVHGCLLAWVVASAAWDGANPPQSIYDQMIRPNEHRLIWYNLRARLPNVSPARAADKPRPLRARKKLNQTVLAGTKDDARAKSMVWMPEPPKNERQPKLERLPNLLAVAPPKAVRRFVPPEDRRRTKDAPPLPEPPVIEPVKPSVEPSLLAVTAPKVVRRFVPPEARHAPQGDPALPEPPAMEASKGAVTPKLLAVTTPKVIRRFVPPEVVRRAPQADPALPEPPAIEASTPASTPKLLAVTTPKLIRRFVPPEAQSRPPLARATLLEAPPEVPKPSPRVEVARLPFEMPPTAATRRFVQPPPPTAVASKMPAKALPPAPELRSVPTPDAATALAIVGLDPAKVAPPLKPPPPREAGFSAGPHPQPGENTTLSNTGLVVPGLLVQGHANDKQPSLLADLAAAPTSRQNLAAALRESHAGVPHPPPQPQATRVSGAPDPRFSGRLIYMMAIQMPNITSFSGNWVVWFAERDPRTGGVPPSMRSPVPLRKVDPKYVAQAAREGVEGVIRLSAIIRKDGSVDTVEILKHLDDRLDRTAGEALAKWEFEPALRDGAPVDVDAIFEIPFRLAPKNPR